MISHENLAHNLAVIVRSLEADDSTVVVSWLPQYHDMGLIGSSASLRPLATTFASLDACARCS